MLTSSLAHPVDSILLAQKEQEAIQGEVRHSISWICVEGLYHHLSVRIPVEGNSKKLYLTPTCNRTLLSLRKELQGSITDINEKYCEY